MLAALQGCQLDGTVSRLECCAELLEPSGNQFVPSFFGIPTLRRVG